VTVTQPSQAHPKKGINANFPKCTSEVTQWFLYINLTNLHKIKVWGQGCEWVARFVPFPCQKGGMGVEMRVLVQNLPFLFLFPDRFRVKLYPSKQKKGVENLPLQDRVRGPACWAKTVHSWKPWKHTVWPPPECGTNTAPNRLAVVA
jgi:hypothetical protein